MLENVFQKYITAKNVIFFILLILFIIFIFQISEIAIMFFASFVIACSLEPIVRRLSTKMGRPVACTVTLLGFLLIIFLFVLATIFLGGNEIKRFAEDFPIYLENIKSFIVSSKLMSRADFAHIDIGGIITSASGVTSRIVEEIINAGRNLGAGLVYLIVSIILVHYFMIDKERIKETTLRLFPKQMRKRAGEIIDTIARKSGGYIIAQVVTMASVGVVVFIGLFLMGNEYAFLLGLITAVFDIVPVIGPAVAFLICMIVLYKSGTIALIVAAIIFGVAQLLENNFVRPYVFSKFLDLHPIIIYLFLFIAAKYMGLIGIVFAPAIAATTVVLIEEVYMKSLDDSK
ncbi:MAG: AI-2E family transporter [bacterium]|nr:AI-2E family transporter [bacterium]